MKRSSILIGWAAIVLPASVQAQVADADAPAVQEAVVDPGAADGRTLADLLDEQPGVTVDPDGRVTVNGDERVRLLLDGRENAGFRPASRAATLAAIPAGDVARIEVRNTPGVAQATRGAGPVIDVITRSGGRGTGSGGQVEAGYGTRDQGYASARATLGSGAVRADVGGSYRRGVTNIVTETDRAQTLAGGVQRTSILADSRRTEDLRRVEGGIAYSIGGADDLSARASYAWNSATIAGTGSNQVTAPGGTVASRTTNRTDSRTPDTALDLVTGWTHRTGGGTRISIEGRHRETINALDRTIATAFVQPARSPGSAAIATRTRNAIDEVALDLTAPLGDGVTLASGTLYQHGIGSQRSLNSNIDPVTGDSVAIPASANLFRVTADAFAAYAELSGQAGGWDLVGGGRVESLDARGRNTNGVVPVNDGWAWRADLLAARDLGKGRRLSLSYAHSFERPEIEDVDPFVRRISATVAARGDPGLRPAQTDRGAVRLAHKRKALESWIEAFGEIRRDEIIDLSVLQGNQVLVTTPVNAGTGYRAGANAGLRLTPRRGVRIGASGEGAWWDPGALGGGVRSVARWSWSAQAFVDAKPWRGTDLRLSGRVDGAQSTVTGTRSAISRVDAVLRHELPARLTLIAQVKDIFGDGATLTRSRYANVAETVRRSGLGRTAFIGLSLPFGDRR